MNLNVWSLAAAGLLLVMQPQVAAVPDDVVSLTYPYVSGEIAQSRWSPWDGTGWYDSEFLPNFCFLSLAYAQAPVLGLSYLENMRIHTNLPGFVQPIATPGLSPVPVPCPAAINSKCTGASGCAIRIRPFVVGPMARTVVPVSGHYCTGRSAFVECIETLVNWWVDRCDWDQASFVARDTESQLGLLSGTGLEGNAFSKDIDCAAYAGLRYDFSWWLGVFVPNPGLATSRLPPSWGLVNTEGGTVPADYAGSNYYYGSLAGAQDPDDLDILLAGEPNFRWPPRWDYNILSSGGWGIPAALVAPFNNGVDDTGFLVSCLKVTYTTVDFSKPFPNFTNGNVEDGVDWSLILDLDAVRLGTAGTSWIGAVDTQLGLGTDFRPLAGIYDMGGDNDCDFGVGGLPPACSNLLDDDGDGFADWTDNRAGAPAPPGQAVGGGCFHSDPDFGAYYDPTDPSEE